MQMLYSAIVAVFPLQNPGCHSTARAVCNDCHHNGCHQQQGLSAVTATTTTLWLWMLRVCTSVMEVVLSRHFRSWLCWKENLRSWSSLFPLPNEILAEQPFISLLQGKLSFANGFILEGTFTNKSGQGLQTHGILNTSSEQLEDRITKAWATRADFSAHSMCFDST